MIVRNKIKLIILSFLTPFLFLATNANANKCDPNIITFDNAISDAWTADCSSTNRSGSYSKYYTFTLNAPKRVMINLDSDVDTYLYLLSNSNHSSSSIAKNDDYNDFNSQISMSLDAGTYTIEASNFTNHEIGEFTLSLSEPKTVEFKGEVALPSSVTNLLDNCSAKECPSVSVFIGDEGVSADFDKSSNTYKYHLAIVENSGIDVNYRVQINIENGDMGDESFDYSFGSDNQVKGEESAEDTLVHQDNAYVKTEPLLVSADTTSVLVNLDLTDKNEGRQKVIGKIRLPFGVNMSNGKNYFDVEIQGRDFWKLLRISRIGTQDNNDYAFIASVPSDQRESTRLSLSINANLRDADVRATYKVYADKTDLNDHKIDGDEKFVLGRLDLRQNYVDFNDSVADFGVMNMAAFLDGYEISSGSIIAQRDLFDNVGESGRVESSVSFYK